MVIKAANYVFITYNFFTANIWLLRIHVNNNNKDNKKEYGIFYGTL